VTTSNEAEITSSSPLHLLCGHVQKKKKKGLARMQSKVHLFSINAEMAAHLLIFYYFLKINLNKKKEKLKKKKKKKKKKP
jgi:uncharacterized membrane protein